MALSTHIQHPLPNLSGQKSHTSPKERSGWVVEKDQMHTFENVPSRKCGETPPPALLTLLVMEI